MRFPPIAFVAALYTLAAGTPAVASTFELERAIWTKLPILHAQYVDIAARREITKAMQEYWHDFDSRTPRLSPEEEAWLEQEQLAGGERYAEAVFSSREGALAWLHKYIGTCLSSIGGISAAQDQAELSQTEMLHWVELAVCYKDVDRAMRYLEQAALSDGSLLGPFYALRYKYIQSEILESIIPSAMADTMGWTLDQTGLSVK